MFKTVDHPFETMGQMQWVFQVHILTNRFSSRWDTPCKVNLKKKRADGDIVYYELVYFQCFSLVFNNDILVQEHYKCASSA